MYFLNHMICKKFRYANSLFLVGKFNVIALSLSPALRFASVCNENLTAR